MKASTNKVITLMFVYCTFMVTSAFAANECRIQYGWNTGNTFQGTFKNHSKKIYLNKGQTKNINKNRMNYVKNLKTRQVKFYLTKISNVTLNKNQRNPAVGTYVGTPKLVKVKCLNTTTSSSASPASPAALVQTLKNQNVPIKEIAKQLRNTFNKTYVEIVNLLKGAGFNKTQIAGALDKAFNLTPAQILSALKSGFSLSINTATNILQGLGASGLQIVGALKSVLNGSIVKIATAMRQAGFTTQSKMNQLAGWLTTKFNAAPDAVVSALYRSGYQLKMIIRYMINTLHLSLDRSVKIMKQLGIPGTDVAKAIVDAGVGATELTVTVAFKAAGWSAAIVMRAIRLAFNAPARVAAAAFKAANYSVDTTTKTLKSVYRISRVQAQRALEYAKFQASQILATLNRYYGQARVAAERTANNVQRRVNTAQTGMALAAPAVAAAVTELQGWFLKAEINKRKCTVNAVNAIGTPGVIRSPYRWKRLVKAALKKAGLSDTVATKWDVAFKRAFTDWARNVTIPGLPWYPSFAAFPGRFAPPALNIPSPLGSLMSRHTPGMAAPNLNKKIFSSLGKGVNVRTRDAVSAFSTQIGTRFSKFLATAQVMLVYGSGPVPSYFPPSVPVGPVIRGQCWGTRILSTSAMTF